LLFVSVFEELLRKKTLLRNFKEYLQLAVDWSLLVGFWDELLEETESFLRGHHFFEKL
jgi:hypothetical protein